MHTKALYLFYHDTSLSPYQQDAVALQQHQDLEARGLSSVGARYLSPIVSVAEGSTDERSLLDYLTSIPAVVYSDGTETPSQRGQQVVHKTRFLIFDDGDASCGYFLRTHGGAYFDEGPDWPPWFVYNNTFGAPLRLLQLQQKDWCFPKLIGHPGDYASKVLLAPNVSKTALEALQIKGIGFEKVSPILSFEEITEDSQPAEFEFAASPRRTRRFNNIVYGAYPADLPPWWVLLPSITLPPMHPLLLRRKPLTKDSFVDINFRGPVEVISSRFDAVPPVYTPEAIAATPPFDIAMSYEQFEFGKYGGRLIVSERGKELISPYLHEPTWTRVGILPANSPVLGGTG